MAIMFTAEEIDFLLEVLEIHEAGLQESREPTMTDPTINSAEQLLTLMAGYETDLQVLEGVRRKLHVERVV
jgi:hypothetical protein